MQGNRTSRQAHPFEWGAAKGASLYWLLKFSPSGNLFLCTAQSPGQGIKPWTA